MTATLPPTSRKLTVSSNVLQNVSSYGGFTITGTNLSWTAVPEPTSALAGTLIVAGLMRRRRGV